MPHERRARRMHFQCETSDHDPFGFFLHRSKFPGRISRRKSFHGPWIFQPDESFPGARLSSRGKHPLTRYHTSWPYSELQPILGQLQMAGTTVATKLEVGLPRTRAIRKGCSVPHYNETPRHQDIGACARHLSVTWDTGEYCSAVRRRKFSGMGDSTHPFINGSHHADRSC